MKVSTSGEGPPLRKSGNEEGDLPLGVRVHPGAQEERSTRRIGRGQPFREPQEPRLIKGTLRDTGAKEHWCLSQRVRQAQEEDIRRPVFPRTPVEGQPRAGVEQIDPRSRPRAQRRPTQGIEQRIRALGVDGQRDTLCI